MFAQHKYYKLILIILALILILIPIFWERLHSDEVLYWDVANNLFTGKGLFSEVENRVYTGHMPLPFILAGFFSLFGEQIFGVRVIAALFTIGCAYLIFLIAERLYSKEVALISSLLFLLSFQALRFGGRFYLDQFGAFFFLLALFCLLQKRFFLSGIFSVLMVLGREYWVGVYPFFVF